MEFSLDMPLVLLALGLSGFLLAHLFSAPELPLRLVACWIYPVHARMPALPLIRYTSRPKMLRVRRKIPLTKTGQSGDDDHSLSCR